MIKNITCSPVRTAVKTVISISRRHHYLTSKRVIITTYVVCSGNISVNNRWNSMRSDRRCCLKCGWSNIIGSIAYAIYKAYIRLTCNCSLRCFDRRFTFHNKFSCLTGTHITHIPRISIDIIYAGRHAYSSYNNRISNSICNYHTFCVIS